MTMSSGMLSRRLPCLGLSLVTLHRFTESISRQADDQQLFQALVDHAMKTIKRRVGRVLFYH